MSQFNDNQMITFRQSDPAFNELKQKLKEYIQKYGVQNFLLLIKSNYRLRGEIGVRAVNDLNPQLMIEFYQFIDSWNTSWFVWPKQIYELKVIHNPLKFISHIAFSNLTKISIPYSFARNIQALAWMNVPVLQHIQFQYNQIVSFQAFSKINLSNLYYVEIRKNMFNHSQLKHFFRGITKNSLQKSNNVKIYLNQAHYPDVINDFTSLLKCNLEVFLCRNEQDKQVQRQLKKKLKQKRVLPENTPNEQQ